MWKCGSAILVPLLQRDEKDAPGRDPDRGIRERYPGRFVDAQVRTLQRRLRDWRAIHGPEKEVFFEQVHVPGREAALDFTRCTELGVTVRGVLLVDPLFEFVLSFSGWTWVELAFGETFEALVAGLQGALWALGGHLGHTSDNLSAATHELRTGGRTLTKRFKAVLDHYGLRSTRIQPGESHENGVVEQRHFRTKRAIAEALVVRGSSDFDSVDESLTFVRDVVDRSHNWVCQTRSIHAERTAVRDRQGQPGGPDRFADWEENWPSSGTCQQE